MEFERAVIIANPRSADYSERVQNSNVRSTHQDTVRAVMAQVDVADRVAMAAWYAKETGDMLQRSVVEFGAIQEARRWLRRRHPGEDMPKQRTAERMIGKDAALVVTASRLNPKQRCNRCGGRGQLKSRKTGLPRDCERCAGEGIKRVSMINNRLWGTGLPRAEQDTYLECHQHVVDEITRRMEASKQRYKKLIKA